MVTDWPISKARPSGVSRPNSSCGDDLVARLVELGRADRLVAQPRDLGGERGLGLADVAAAGDDRLDREDAGILQPEIERAGALRELPLVDERAVQPRRLAAGEDLVEHRQRALNPDGSSAAAAR